MKDIVKERLINLATAQEYMADVTDKMDLLNMSQLFMENSAFEAMNVSDTILNLSKEGSILVERFQDCCKSMVGVPCLEDNEKVSTILKEIQELFQNIATRTQIANEIAHRIEKEVATQKEIKEEIRKNNTRIKESLDSAVACADLAIADM